MSKWLRLTTAVRLSCLCLATPGGIRTKEGPKAAETFEQVPVSPSSPSRADRNHSLTHRLRDEPLRGARVRHVHPGAGEAHFHLEAVAVEHADPVARDLPGSSRHRS